MEPLFGQIGECEELQETITSLKQQLSEAQEHSPLSIPSRNQLETKTLHQELLNAKEGSALKYAKQTFLLQAQVTIVFLFCGFINLLHLN